MKSNKEKIIEGFHKVQELGFVESRRSNNTGIGKTFEDLIGVVENNLAEPDLYGYEIKSHRTVASSYVTLFTKSPDFPDQANAYLKDKYGTPYEDNPLLKRLHTSMFANKYNSYNNQYSFKLINDKNKEQIRIGVYDIKTHDLIDDTVGYTYESLKSVLKNKLQDLFYVEAKTKYQGEKEYFNFNKAEIYSSPSIEKFFNLLDNGLIMYDIRIGSYKSGKSFGKAHDHGSGFRIIESNIKLLYEEMEEIN